MDQLSILLSMQSFLLRNHGQLLHNVLLCYSVFSVKPCVPSLRTSLTTKLCLSGHFNHSSIDNGVFDCSFLASSFSSIEDKLVFDSLSSVVEINLFPLRNHLLCILLILYVELSF
uniref:Uncharacterized protein n=1 Tax=Clytia hemisphaerica TaxID=252671 RepID=A0A7M5V4D6_9CNID